MKLEILELTLFIIVTQLTLRKVRDFVMGWLGIMPKKKASSKTTNPTKEQTEQQKRIRQLQEQIRQLSQEAQVLNTPSSFAKHAKLQRRIVKLQNQIESRKSLIDID